MPLVQFGASVSLSFASPHEMVEMLSSVIDGQPVFVAGEGPDDPEAEFDVLILVPWLGRRLSLRGRVQEFTDREAVRGVLIRLIDGAADTIEQLQSVLVRIRTGAILEAQPGDPPATARVRSMNATLRGMLAVKADLEERKILAEDNDPRVLDLLLANPRISLVEIRNLVTRRTLTAKHFRIIMGNPAWMKDETVRMNISLNPRLPEFMAPAVLQTMSTPFLQQLTRSINVRTSTKRAAVKILKARGVPVSMKLEGL